MQFDPEAAAEQPSGASEERQREAEAYWQEYGRGAEAMSGDACQSARPFASTVPHLVSIPPLTLLPPAAKHLVQETCRIGCEMRKALSLSPFLAPFRSQFHPRFLE